MPGKHETAALVIDSGPVGLFVALAELGVDAAILDQQPHAAARSYALALHPTLLRRPSLQRP